MEIKRRFIIENRLMAAGHELLPVAQIYTSWTVGKGGIYAFFDKRPVLVVIKAPSGEVTVMDMNGSVLTLQQAIEMVPGLEEVLMPR